MKKLLIFIPLVAFFLLAASNQKIKIFLEVEDSFQTQQFNLLVCQSMIDAINETNNRYQIVDSKKEANYLIKGKLAKAEEIMVDKVPTSNVFFILRVFEIDSGRENLDASLNSIASRILVGVSLENAIQEVVKDVVKDSLPAFKYKFKFKLLKKGGD